ncbi:galactosyl transferase [Basidiobolus meristosporus CBS 931.73]|uniref:Galactosyl transferase n=1 Tax=Basidiobolus meristosporus CBS 931.73 TaxID=1314790 RepID=A0A1Y1X6G7_9FUNG|nr:galactosyl transferase [Basidiobolus meristosporus CBS 931.73]|eukprot:ORX81302.1 galactosyl transferase [Basidiobolus meristosporus CBS 931.73]
MAPRSILTSLLGLLCTFPLIIITSLDAYPTEQLLQDPIYPEDIAMVMAWDQKMEEHWVPRTLQDKHDYAKRHGYELLINNATDDGRASSWSKIIHLHQAMLDHPSKRWFWWIDVDSLIMEQRYTIEDHVLSHVSQNRHFEKDIVMSWDCNGLNTGSIFMRNSDWSRKFLEDMLEQSWDDPHKYGEQRKMQGLFHSGQEVVDHFNFIPLRKACAALNHKCDLDNKAENQYNYHDGDFLVHFANCAPDRCHAELDRFHSILYSK